MEWSYVKINLKSCPAIAFYKESKALITNYIIILMKNHDAFTAVFGTSTAKADRKINLI